MRDISQVVRRTPWDTPVPFYTRTSPWPRIANRFTRIGLKLPGGIPSVWPRHIHHSLFDSHTLASFGLLFGLLPGRIYAPLFGPSSCQCRGLFISSRVNNRIFCDTCLQTPVSPDSVGCPRDTQLVSRRLPSVCAFLLPYLGVC